MSSGKLNFTILAIEHYVTLCTSCHIPGDSWGDTPVSDKKNMFKY